jgi:poly(A) polymerase
LGSHGELDIYDFLLEEEKKLKEKPALRPPLLTGHDLISMGMKPGPAMGKLLGRIRDLQLQDELQTPEQARRWVREELGGGRK